MGKRAREFGLFGTKEEAAFFLPFYAPLYYSTLRGNRVECRQKLLGIELLQGMAGLYCLRDAYNIRLQQQYIGLPMMMVFHCLDRCS